MISKMKKTFLILLTLFVLVSMPNYSAYCATAVRSVIINPLKKAEAGNTYQLSYTVYPDDAQAEVVKWSVDSSCGSISNNGVLKISSNAKAGKYKVTLKIQDTSTGKDFTSSLYIDVKTSEPETTKKETTTKKQESETTVKKTTTEKNNSDDKEKNNSSDNETTEATTETTTVIELLTEIETSANVFEESDKENEFDTSLGEIKIEYNDEEECFVITMEQNNDAVGYVLYISNSDDENDYKIIYTGTTNVYKSHLLNKNKTYYFRYKVYKLSDNEEIVMSSFSKSYKNT